MNDTSFTTKSPIDKDLFLLSGVGSLGRVHMQGGGEDDASGTREAAMREGTVLFMANAMKAENFPPVWLLSAQLAKSPGEDMRSSTKTLYAGGPVNFEDMEGRAARLDSNSERVQIAGL
jgi:hypothetical protein